MIKRILLIVILFTTIGYSQKFDNLNGFTLYATNYVEDLNSKDDIETNMVMSFSFNDRLFVHNILPDLKNDIKEMKSQIYFIKEYNKVIMEDGVLYTIVVVSGTSKKEYKYEAYVTNNEGKIVVRLNDRYYYGYASYITPYIQDNEAK